MKRVLSVVQTPTYGGPHNRITRLEPCLKQRGYETLVCLPEECESGLARMFEAGVSVHTLPIHRMRKSLSLRPHVNFAMNFLPTIARLKTLMKAERVDVVQVCGLMGVHAGVAAKQLGLPVVWQILGTFAPMPLRRILVPLVQYCADVVMSTGRATAVQHPGIERFGKRLFYFYPPVDLQCFRFNLQRRVEIRRRLGVSDEEMLIGTVGNRNRAKGHDDLVAIARRVCQSRADVKFLIKGELSDANRVDYEESVMTPLRATGLVESGRFQFAESSDSVFDILSALDVFILTSRAEGVPTAVLEAMAMGVPVVSSDVGSIGEIVSHGKDGWLVAPSDIDGFTRSLNDLLDNPERRESFGKAAVDRAIAEFGIESCAEAHVAAYEKALTLKNHR